MKNILETHHTAEEIVTHLTEVAYAGNMGFQEMMTFYQEASSSQIDKLENLLRKEEFKQAWKLVQDVTGINLKGNQFN